MKAKDLLSRAQRLLADRGEFVGRVHLYYEDAAPARDGEDPVYWRTVDAKDYPPGPKRDALLEGATIMTGPHDQWVDILDAEDEEARRATA